MCIRDSISSFSNPTLCFPDGSKSENRVGFAFSVGDATVTLRRRNPASSYTAELQAPFLVVSNISLPPLSLPPPVFSDSLAALSAIAQPSSSHPLVTPIHSLLTTFTAISIPVTFIRVPGHRSISGNENVDPAAKQALLLPSIHQQIYPPLLV